ncbi:MAG: hypothetical protein MRY69_05080, partial [Phaeobacter italicus]
MLGHSGNDLWFDSKHDDVCDSGIGHILCREDAVLTCQSISLFRIRIDNRDPRGRPPTGDHSANDGRRHIAAADESYVV